MQLIPYKFSQNFNVHIETLSVDTKVTSSIKMGILLNYFFNVMYGTLEYYNWTNGISFPYHLPNKKVTDLCKDICDFSYIFQKKFYLKFYSQRHKNFS